MRRKSGDELKLAKRELKKQRRRYRAKKNRARDAEGQEQSNCRYCEEEGEATSDRQKWKKKMERYSRKKYQDEEMKKKARKELDEWEERCWKGYVWEGQGPGLTMADLMQSGASFSNGKAVGIDGISAEILKSLPWRVLQKIRKAFEMRYLGQNKEEIEAWLRIIIVLIPKKRTMNRMEGQTKRSCVQSVLAKWYCACLSILLEMEQRSGEKRQEMGGHSHLWV